MASDRTAVLTSSAFLGHDTGDHVERAARIAAIHRELERRGMLRDRLYPSFKPATNEQILAVHSTEHLESLEKFARMGGGWLDHDTVMRPDSLDIARLAAGAGIAAIDGLLNGSWKRAFVIARPPGHHATPHRAMGFCLLNTIAITAAYAHDQGFRRIAIVDWDVHHGNGTQDIFYRHDHILYCSLHQWPLFPGAGSREEIGLDAGTGFTINIPLPAGASSDAFLEAFHRNITGSVDRFQPNLILVSAGYDAHADDPLGDIRLNDNTYNEMTEELLALANRWCNGALVFVLEGGYNVDVLARCVVNTIETLDCSESSAREI